MDDKYRFGKDEDGSLTCPIPKCDAVLYVARTYSVPLWHPDSLPPEEQHYPAPVDDSVSDTWEVVCEEGHTIDCNEQANDWYEPFSLAWLLATGHGQPPVCAMCSKAIDYGTPHRGGEHDDLVHNGCWAAYEKAAEPR